MQEVYLLVSLFASIVKVRTLKFPVKNLSCYLLSMGRGTNTNEATEILYGDHSRSVYPVAENQKFDLNSTRNWALIHPKQFLTYCQEKFPEDLLTAVTNVLRNDYPKVSDVNDIQIFQGGDYALRVSFLDEGETWTTDLFIDGLLEEPVLLRSLQGMITVLNRLQLKDPELQAEDYRFLG